MKGECRGSVEKMVSQVNILRRKALRPWESLARASVCAHAGERWKVWGKADGEAEGRKPAMALPGHMEATAGPHTGR